MRAMILAAGRGARMGVLTQETPKPLLKLGKHYLIEHSILKLSAAGIQEIIINVSYYREKIKSALGDGKKYGVSICYSEEETPLETGGGIFKALPLLGDQPFLVLSCDIISDFIFSTLAQKLTGLAHLVMVNNPDFHQAGDFGLQHNKILTGIKPQFTFANIGVYDPALFANCNLGEFPLRSILMPAIREGKVTGELFLGDWHNLGTPEQLNFLSQRF